MLPASLVAFRPGRRTPRATSAAWPSGHSWVGLLLGIMLGRPWLVCSLETTSVQVPLVVVPLVVLPRVLRAVRRRSIHRRRRVQDHPSRPGRCELDARRALRRALHAGPHAGASSISDGLTLALTLALTLGLALTLALTVSLTEAQPCVCDRSSRPSASARSLSRRHWC